MSHVYCDIYVHLIWRTKYSRRILKGSLENFVHHRMSEIGTECKVDLLAVNSAWNHTHSLFRWNTTHSISEVVKRLKGDTSTEWNGMVRSAGIEVPLLSWQVGYGVISVSRSRVEHVIKYIANQKEHHRNKDLEQEFEAFHYYDC